MIFEPDSPSIGDIDENATRDAITPRMPLEGVITIGIIGTRTYPSAVRRKGGVNATLLDTALVIPGTGIRFGLDALIGFFPVLGDTITTALSLFIVHEAYQLGAPGHVIARMLGNVALDGVLGAVPLVGDVFDVLWRANRRNVRLLLEWLEYEHRREFSFV